MIEPLTAFALAGNILQFVEAGYKATVILRQIWHGSATDENQEIEMIAQNIGDMSKKLVPTSSMTHTVSKDEETLRKLARKCKDLADELNAMLQDLLVRSSGAKRRVEAVQKTLKLMYRQSKIEQLQKRLQDLSNQISGRMLFMLW